ncbi:MAG: nucleoid-associated protein YgaU [Pseudohongiellaceae bacterium]|jgi:nucleoid-associated protein YgaU
MTDVEKYGLFALLFVVSILGLAWVLGPDDTLANGLQAADGGALSVVLERPAKLNTPQGQPPEGAGKASQRAPRKQGATSQGTGPRGRKMSVGDKPQVAHYAVASLLDTQSDFRFDDPPVSYPGERSARLPVSQAGLLQHTIRANETLSDVSKRYYGTNHDWRVILKANPGLDETKLQVGQVVMVPRKATKGQVGGALASKGIYVVREGDTLGGIAMRELGSIDRTNDLFGANRDVMATPDKLKVGMHLRIP